MREKLAFLCELLLCVVKKTDLPTKLIKFFTTNNYKFQNEKNNYGVCVYVNRRICYYECSWAW